MENEILGKKGFPTDEVPSFIANIKIPVDIDRREFIKYCYKTGTVFVLGVDNQFESNVLISRDLIHQLVFPNDSVELGSTVLCITDSIYGTSKIVGIFQDVESEQEIFEENQWRILKINGDSFVDLDAKGNTGELNFVVNSGGNNGISSNFRFLNSQNKAKLNFEIQGVFDIEVDDEFNIYSQRLFNLQIENTDDDGKPTVFKIEDGEGLTFLDEFENSISTNENGVYIKIDSGEEFGLTKEGFLYKNNKADLKNILIDFLDSISQSIIQTPSGPGSFDPNTLAKLNKTKVDVKNLFK